MKDKNSVSSSNSNYLLLGKHPLFQFGHGLQQLLTTVPYSEVAGNRNIEWDALSTVSMTLPRLLLSPPFLTRLSYHVSSGRQLSPELANDILKCRCFYLD